MLVHHDEESHGDLAQDSIPLLLKHKQSTTLEEDGSNIEGISSSLGKKLPVIVYKFLFMCNIILCFTILIVVFSLPSYSDVPSHYRHLRNHVESKNISGRANHNQEKVFIAISLYDPDGALVSGSWGQQLLDLIDLLGPSNTYLSIFQSDSGQGAQLDAFSKKVLCKHKIVTEPTAPIGGLQIFEMPDGDAAVSRIAYLASARNKALEPLNELDQYDKILYLNDVFFDPIEAAQLLFLTNSRMDGSRATYGAACAMDFVNPVHYYDTFATRDTEGHGIKWNVYPWFAAAGEAKTRQDIMTASDHVRVTSCWGGMVAFDATLFQDIQGPGEPLNETVRFRSENELGWESSECCLIHADIKKIRNTADIYMNPYIRVAYSKQTFSWLKLVRKIERFFIIARIVFDQFVPAPDHERRAVKVGEAVLKRVWSKHNQSIALLDPANWETKMVSANPGSFCGQKGTFIRRLTPTSYGGRADTPNWESVPAWLLPQPPTNASLEVL